MTKSAKTFPFIAVFGLYLISNSLNSMAYFINLSEARVCVAFYWDFNGMSLEIRVEFLGCGYQIQDQFLHPLVPLLCSSQSSAAIVDRMLYSVFVSNEDDVGREI